MTEAFAGSCDNVLSLACRALQEEAQRIQGVEGDRHERPGLAGRSERHFQATLFEGFHRGGLRVTVEDAYFGHEHRETNLPTSDLAVELDPGTWLWLEIKRVRPGELGFATLNVVRADARKLDEMAGADLRNFPQAIMLVLIRAHESREHSASWYWESINQQSSVGRWPFVRHRIEEIRFNGDRRGEMMVAMWARQSPIQTETPRVTSDVGVDKAGRPAGREW